MGTEIERHEEPQTITTTTGPDPTGGRLVAWAQAARAAHSLATSLVKTPFVPLVGTKNNRRPLDAASAAAMILAGDEVGFTPIMALRSIYLVHGTPAFTAKAMAALVLSQGHDFWVEEETTAKVVVAGRRKGSDHDQRVTWTMDRARKAGYTSNSKYDTNPQEMLYARAVSELCRRLAPDVLAGMPYSAEELELSEEPTTTTVTRESAKVSRAKAKPQPEEPSLDDAPQTPQGQESPDVAASVEGPGVGAPDAPPAPADPTEPPLDDDEPMDAEVVDDKPTPTPDTKKATQAQVRKIVVMMNEQGITEKAHVMSYLKTVTKTDYESRKDLTREHAHEVIEALTFDAEQAADDAAAARQAQGEA